MAVRQEHPTCQAVGDGRSWHMPGFAAFPRGQELRDLEDLSCPLFQALSHCCHEQRGCKSAMPPGQMPRGLLAFRQRGGFVPAWPRKKQRSGFHRTGCSSSHKTRAAKGSRGPSPWWLGLSCPKTANWVAELEAQICSCPVWLGARSITLVASPWQWQ